MHYEAGDGAEHHHVVVEMMLDEVIEAVHADGRPGARDVHGEITARGLEFDLEGFRSLFFEQSGMQQRAIVAGRSGPTGGWRRGFCWSVCRSLRLCVQRECEYSYENSHYWLSHSVSSLLSKSTARNPTSALA